MCNAASMGDHIHILVVHEVLMYSTVLGNVVVDKDKSQMHYKSMGLQIPKRVLP